MTERERIEARIAELEGELARAEGRPTEVYSRIVGYYRPVRNWNAGKRAEYAERLAFSMPRLGQARGQAAVEARPAPAEPAAPAEAAPAPSSPREPARAEPGKGYLVFTRAACPNCPPVKNYVVGSGLPATFVDVDLAEGLELARRHGVLSTPTVLGLDAEGRELFRALDLGQLKAGLGAARA
ncbi:MAG TPA: anaerobic ribonucleoside-triphosphate reductase [Spirochaetales bacterium]|nr:anaerobic ribonucleoside-triphosphate reductase [Spirochaetales bacterium]HRY53409.1 anaerobic ribonucleoside-triphosphate reductase [Spirochaetia bacterium]HRZ63551.1 anaerobic ribonucleoside-triphosphate reductase [Spirochaetia bacterium]